MWAVSGAGREGEQIIQVLVPPLFFFPLYSAPGTVNLLHGSDCFMFNLGGKAEGRTAKPCPPKSIL